MADIITLQQYKDFHGITKTDQDAKLNVIIPAASNLIKAYIGVPLTDYWETPYVEYLNVDYDSDTLFTTYWPIRDVVSITEWNRYTTDSTIHVPLTGGADYEVVGDKIVRLPRPGGFGTWPVGPATVRVEYRAGFETTPGDLQLAAIFLIDYYKDKGFLPSRTIQGTTVVNAEPKSAELPNHVKAILDHYKIY